MGLDHPHLYTINPHVALVFNISVIDYWIKLKLYEHVLLYNDKLLLNFWLILILNIRDMIFLFFVLFVYRQMDVSCLKWNNLINR